MDEHFLKPKYVGRRFENHSIPLDVLSDLSAIEDLLRELARDSYLVEEERERLPEAGYFDNVEIALTEVREGSAVPVIELQGSEELTHYFERGRERLLAGLNAAREGGNVTAFIPQKQLRHFEKLGAHLQSGEVVQFDPSNERESRRAEFDTGVRNKLNRLYQQSIEGIETVTIRGPVIRFDLAARTFTVRPPFGGAIDISIDSIDWNVFSTAVSESKSGRKLEISGDLDVKTRKIEDPTSIKLLDAYDVRARLDELARLRRGWMGNNDGRQIDNTVVQFLGDFLVERLGDFKAPRLYPTEMGGIEAEWNHRTLDISMEINPTATEAYVHILDIDKDEDREFEIADLRAEGSLDELREVLKHE